MDSVLEKEEKKIQLDKFLPNDAQQKIIDQKNRGIRIQHYLAEKKHPVPVSESGCALEDMKVPLSFEELMYYNRYAEIPQLGHHIYGPLNVDALKASFKTLVERQQALCTVYTEKNNQLSRHRVDSDWFSLNEIDLRSVSSKQHQTFIHQQAKEDFNRIVSFKNPLFQASLFFIEENHAILLVSGNHIVLDIWGVGVLFNELSVLYGAYAAGKPSPLEPLPMSYEKFVTWQQEWYQGRRYEKLEKYWAKRFDGLPVSMDLPMDRPRLEETGCIFVTAPVNISEELLNTLTEFASQEKTTLFNTMLTIVSILLARYSKQKDVVVGYPKAGRIRSDYADMIGNLTDLMACRNVVDPQLSFKESLLALTKNAFRDYAHIQMPFLLLKNLLKRESGKDYQSLLRFCVNILPENGELELPGTKTKSLEMGEIKDNSKGWIPRVEDGIDFRFFINRGVATLTYNSELYDASTVEEMLTYFDYLVASILKEPSRPLADLGLGL